MIVRVPAAFLTFLVSLIWAGTLCAKQRTPPVLRSGGTYSSNQADSQKDKNSDSTDVDEGSVVRVSTSLITVPAVVMDRNGRYIANLRKEDFHIYEDGVEQNVSYFASVERPFTVALMLDVSGSTQSEMSQIREAANIFVGRLRANDRLMAITFDGKINVLTEAEDVSAVRRTKLHDDIQGHDERNRGAGRAGVHGAIQHSAPIATTPQRNQKREGAAQSAGEIDEGLCGQRTLPARAGRENRRALL